MPLEETKRADACRLAVAPCVVGQHVEPALLERGSNGDELGVVLGGGAAMDQHDRCAWLAGGGPRANGEFDAVACGQHRHAASQRTARAALRWRAPGRAS